MSTLKTLPPSCLLVAFDETGHEELADAKYPIFGLGGCAVLVGDYEATVAEPWRRLKGEHFGGRNVPLHASELRNASAVQLTAVAQFFASQHFRRFAAVSRAETIIGNGLTRFEAVALASCNELRSVTAGVEFSSSAVIFEGTERGEKLIRQTFSTDAPATLRDGSPNPWAVPTTFYVAHKPQAEPLVEVADFIMHSAGTAVRANSDTGVPLLNRRDFAVVFGTVPKQLYSFIRLDALQPNTEASAT